MEKTDMQLIEQTLSNNLQAFDELMKRYQKLVYSIGYSFGKTRENALDISQDVFLKVYKKLNTFKGNSSFKTWLTRISFHECINWQKKNSKYSDNKNPEEFDMNLSTQTTQEDELFAKEHKAMLLRSLYELNTKYRLAVVLRYFENQSTKEIATSLKCSEGVVKNMLFRSLQKLRTLHQEA